MHCLFENGTWIYTSYSVTFVLVFSSNLIQIFSGNETRFKYLGQSF